METKYRKIDVYLGKYKWYRKLIGGNWYKHQFTEDALQISLTWKGTWWARYWVMNRYSIVIEQEIYKTN